RGHTAGATSCASPPPRSSCASCWRRLHPRLPSAVPPPSGLFPPLLLLRCCLRPACPLSDNRLHPGNVLAQSANLLQAFGLAHVELELQLEQLVRELPLVILQLRIGLVTNLVHFHDRFSFLSAPLHA